MIDNKSTFLDENDRQKVTLVAWDYSFERCSSESFSSLKNERKSAASFCHQVAAWFPDMFCNFNLLKNHKIDKYSTNTNFKKFFDAYLAKCNNHSNFT